MKESVSSGSQNPLAVGSSMKAMRESIDWLSGFPRGLQVWNQDKITPVASSSSVPEVALLSIRVCAAVPMLNSEVRKFELEENFSCVPPHSLKITLTSLLSTSRAKVSQLPVQLLILVMSSTVRVSPVSNLILTVALVEVASSNTENIFTFSEYREASIYSLSVVGSLESLKVITNRNLL